MTAENHQVLLRRQIGHQIAVQLSAPGRHIENTLVLRVHRTERIEDRLRGHDHPCPSAEGRIVCFFMFVLRKISDVYRSDVQDSIF